MQGKLPAGVQTHFRSIITDGFLRVKGSEGAIFAIGDAATIEQVKLAILLSARKAAYEALLGSWT